MRYSAWKVDIKKGIIYTGYSRGYGVAFVEEDKSVKIKYADHDTDYYAFQCPGEDVEELRNNSYYIQTDKTSGIFLMPEVCPYFNWSLVFPDAHTGIIVAVNNLVYDYCVENYFISKAKKK